MWSKKWYIILIPFFLSCQKEDYSVNKEDALSTDTVSFVLDVDYISNSATEVQVYVDLMTIDGRKPWSSYLISDLEDTELTEYDIHNIAFDQFSVIQDAGQNYSNLFLLNQSNSLDLAGFELGFYLRHYVETVEKNGLNRTGLSYFFESNNQYTSFLYSSTESLLNVPSEEIISTFYDLTRDQNQGNHTTSFAYLINCIDQAIDELVNDENLVGEKYITVLNYDGVNYNEIPTIEIEAIITKAQLNGVHINFIGRDLSTFVMKIAFETDGFVFDQHAYDPLNQWEVDNAIHEEKAGVILQNLDEILSNKYPKARCRFTITNADGSLFSPTDTRTFNFYYQGRPFFAVGTIL